MSFPETCSGGRFEGEGVWTLKNKGAGLRHGFCSWLGVMNGEARRTHYDELGLVPGADRKKVERAFWEIRTGREGGGARRGALRAAEQAYLVLSDPGKRRAYDRLIGIDRHPAWEETARDAAEARNTYRRALALLERKREEEALGLLKACVRLHPGEALYRSSLALLLARRGRGVKKGFRLGMEAYRQSPGDRGVAENTAAICDIAGLHKRASAIRRALGDPAG